MINDSWFTSGNDQWATPRWLAQQIVDEFAITLDACTQPDTAVVRDFYAPPQDALTEPWHGNVYCNPPYGRGTSDWFAHGLRELAAGRAGILVYLTPARTDTRWWHEHVLRAHEIRFFRGRLTYGLPGQAKSAAPFPSALSIFRPGTPPVNPLVLSVPSKPANPKESR